MSLFVSITVATAQLNVELVANLDYDDVLNDIWGYVNPAGVEYALVGTTEGFSIVSLEDPTNPVELQFIPGQSTVWRDIKTWGNFAYVVSDNATEGILIVDMSTLPADTAAYTYWTGPVGDLGTVYEIHNIFIDEYGLAYLAGSNLGSIIVLDVKEDPWNPNFILKTNAPYAHDVYTRDSIIYGSEIYAGEFNAYDMSDPDNVQHLGGATTPYNFTHNAWLSDDSKTIFTTDERANAFIGSYDISDFANVKELDRYRPAATVGEDVIPHNVHVLNDYLIISYYTDGVIVVDASEPDNLIEVGNYDTYLGEHGDYNGSWGAYPFLPSGTVLVSDRQSGLFVLTPNYVRGCYLNGTVLNALTNEPILNVEISISGDEIITPDMTDIAGEFKMGKAIPGSYLVSASHSEYIPQSVELVFENGELTEVLILMDPIEQTEVFGTVMSSASQSVAANVNVVLANEEFLYETTTDSEGLYSFGEVYNGDYNLYAGNWGEYSIEGITVSSPVNGDIEINPGYYDDFQSDYNWLVSGNSTGAEWVRDVPNLQTLGEATCGPGEDILGDIGHRAFITGNEGSSAWNNSVEGGFTVLTSPMMDLSSMSVPTLRFNPWLCVRFEDVEGYFVLLSSETETITMDTIMVDGVEGYWRDTYEYDLSDYMATTSEMQIHFVAENADDGNVVKAGLDVFMVFDNINSGTNDIDLSANFGLYPNPSSTEFSIDLGDNVDQISPDRILIVNNLGQIVDAINWPNGQNIARIDHNLVDGIYFVQLTSKGNVMGAKKLVVH